MQYSLGKESYAGDDGTGCCGRNALNVVNNNSIKNLNILTCRRNTLEAISSINADVQKSIGGLWWESEVVETLRCGMVLCKLA